MKHPELSVLQDYFENVLAGDLELRVKEHVLGCDKCTQVLFQFGQIENRLKAQSPLNVSETTESKILSDAKKLLAERRAKAIKEKEHSENLKVLYQEWKEFVFPEIKIPAIQLCSVSLLLASFIAMEQLKSVEEEHFEPFSTAVTVYGFEDTSIKSEDL